METSRNHPTSPWPPRLGVALGSGGLRGLAHIGVLKVLEEQGIPVYAISGASIGALIAAAWAVGAAAAELEAGARHVARLPRLARLLEPGPPLVSIASTGRLAGFLRNYLGETRFEETRIPLAMVATDLDTGEPVVLREGLLLDGVLASTAVPGIFPPVEMAGRRLVDGALSDPIPVALASDLGADVVLAVDVGPSPDWEMTHKHRGRRPGLVEALVRTGIILTHQLTALRLAQEPPAVLLRPAMDEALLMLGAKHAAEAIAAGESAAREALPHLRELLAMVE